MMELTVTDLASMLIVQGGAWGLMAKLPVWVAVMKEDIVVVGCLRVAESEYIDVRRRYLEAERTVGVCLREWNVKRTNLFHCGGGESIGYKTSRESYVCGSSSIRVVRRSFVHCCELRLAAIVDVG